MRQGNCNTTQHTFTNSAKLLSTQKNQRCLWMHFGMESKAEQAPHQESCQRQVTPGKGMVQNSPGAGRSLAGFVLISAGEDLLNLLEGQPSGDVALAELWLHPGTETGAHLQRRTQHTENKDGWAKAAAKTLAQEGKKVFVPWTAPKRCPLGECSQQDEIAIHAF